MGWAIGRGLHEAGFGDRILACDRNEEKRVRLSEQTEISTTPDWTSVVAQTDLLLLCIRTEQVEDFLEKAASHFKEETALVSVSAGIDLATIERPLRSNVQAVRAITNVNTVDRSGYTLVHAPESRDEFAKRAQRQAVLLFDEIGVTKVVRSERDLNRLSVLPGCMPAVVSLMLESFQDFGIESGFESEEAREIALAVASDTIQTIRATDEEPSAFKHLVASSGGIVDRLLEDPKTERVTEGSKEWLRTILESVD